MTPYRHQVADVLEKNFEEVYSLYERKLEAAQNLLVTESAKCGGELKDQARVLVIRAAEMLRGGGDGVLALEEEIFQNMEAARSPLIQHPDESFRAGVALCEASLEVILAKVDLSGKPPEAVVRLSLDIQKSVMDHIARVAMVSYVDYLLAKIGEVQIEERHRFSRELHDRIAHSMALVKQNLELFEALRARDPETAEAKLENARETAEQAMEVARDIALDLRNSDTGESLEVALGNLIRASVPPGVEVEVEVSGKEDLIPTHVRDQLYLMLREGLRNAVSHSGGQSVKLGVEVSSGEVVAYVEDWGDGFDPSDPSANGVGLRSMRERAKLLRGSFNIISTPGEGARAEVRAPIRKGKR